MVHVDAHLDTSASEVWGEEFHHGTPFRHAIAEGLIAEGELYQVGVRAPLNSADDERLLADFGTKAYPMPDLISRGVIETGRAIRSRIRDRPTYISFDIDAIDPSCAPGTGTPVPGGLHSREAIALLRALVGVPLVGMDLVEVAPGLDHADITCHLGAHLLYEGIALLAARS